MLPRLSVEQRRAVAEIGLPLPLYDPQSEAGYLLFPAHVAPHPSHGFLASVAGFEGEGTGGTPEAAIFSLAVLLTGSRHREGEF